MLYAITPIDCKIASSHSQHFSLILHMKIFEAAYLIPDSWSASISAGAVAIENDVVRDMGLAVELRRRYPQAEAVRIDGAAIIPGFVNAHQHGRGLSQIQLGYRDDALEPWQQRRRARGAPDAYSLTLLAASEMIANGVTATVHAPYSYGSGDYESEIRAVTKAYDEAGIRVTVCIGFADRGGLVYPPASEPEFSSQLSPSSQALLRQSKEPYLGLDDTLTLMGKLQEEYAGHSRIQFAYGPSGPQMVSDKAWKAMAQDAVAKGVGFHLHLLESPAQGQALPVIYPEGVLRRLQNLGVFEAPVSAAHFVQASNADITQAAELGLIIVTNPGSNLRLYNGVPPIAQWRQAGLTIALGTDNCAMDDNEDYLSELRLGGMLARSTDHDDRVATQWLLNVATVAGAQAAFMPDVGALRPGMKADFIALDLTRVHGAYLDTDADLLRAILARGSGCDVAMTVIGGEIRYQNSDKKGHDDHPIFRQAAAAAEAARTAGVGAAEAAEHIAIALRHHYYSQR